DFGIDQEIRLFPAFDCRKSKSPNERRVALAGTGSALARPAATAGGMQCRRGRNGSRGHPHKVLQLTRDQGLEEELSAFAQGHFHLLILVGAGGLPKSRSVKAVLNGKACGIKGNATPFGMYVKLYRHRDQFVVIDDVDALYANRSGVRLLKCVCQTEEEKAVAWHSDARGLERQGGPRGFTTRSTL